MCLQALEVFPRLAVRSASRMSSAFGRLASLRQRQQGGPASRGPSLSSVTELFVNSLQVLADIPVNEVAQAHFHACDRDRDREHKVRTDYFVREIPVDVAQPDELVVGERRECPSGSLRFKSAQRSVMSMPSSSLRMP